jgi:hypothetical protein
MSIPQADIPRMNPWNGGNASILPGSGEAMGGRHSFPVASAVHDLSNELLSIDLALSLVIQTHSFRGDDPSAPFSPMFALDNNDLIYLHDTNEGQLSNRAQRALSMAASVSSRRGRWPPGRWASSEKAIDSMVARGSTYAVPVPEDIGVALIYSTRFPDQHGEIMSYPDVYSHQRARSE